MCLTKHYLLKIPNILQTTFYPIRMLSVLPPIPTKHVATHLRRSHRSPISFSLVAHFSCHCTTFSYNTFWRFFSFFSSSNFCFSVLTSCFFSRIRFRSASEWVGKLTIWPRSFETSSSSCKWQQNHSISNDT